MNEAKHQIIMAKSVDEVKNIRDKAEALRIYAKQANLGLEIQNDCAEIKIRAERKAGEILAKIELDKGGRPSENQLHDVTSYPKLKELGITKIQSYRWQLEAEVPEEKFALWTNEVKTKAHELTSVGLRRLALQLKPRQYSIESTPWPTESFRTIVIDPPWPIEKILRDERLHQYDLDYPTMTIEQIKLLSIPELAFKDGCHIYLWATHRFLPIAFEVFEEWEVNYECLLTWVKNVGITPFSWMYSTEHCLFGRIGNLPLVTVGKRLDFYAKVKEHSRKPKEFYDLVREVSPEPRIDIYSREKHEGFAQYGNESAKFTAKEKAVAR